MLHHHHQIPSILNAIDGGFGAVAAVDTRSTSSPFDYQHLDTRQGVQGYQDTSPLERFLLEDHDQQSTILALDFDVGALNISPEI